MCILQFAYCDDCNFARHFASVHCKLYLAKLYKYIGYGEGQHPDNEPCPNVKYQARVRIGPLACPNRGECPKVAREPAIRRAMEADRIAKLLKKQRAKDAIEAKKRQFAEKYFIRQKPTLSPQHGLLDGLVKAEKEASACSDAFSSSPNDTSTTLSFREYMLQRQSGSYSNVFDESDDGSDEECASLSADSGSKTSSRDHEPKTVSQDNQLGRSLPICIKNPGRRYETENDAEGTDAHIASLMAEVFSVFDDKADTSGHRAACRYNGASRELEKSKP